MSSMLEQAIVDATALREVALSKKRTLVYAPKLKRRLSPFLRPIASQLALDLMSDI